MNANELANKSFMELWDSYTSKKMECEDLHEMLSQQQAEIEALKNQLWDLKSEPWGFDRHPVKELTLTHEEYDNIFANGKRLGVIETENRLWKAMQLTYEEINIVGIKVLGGIWNCYDEELVEFARAILRKAQEK